MDIFVLVVDDSIPNAEVICDSVELYTDQSKFGVTYKVIKVCKGKPAFREAKEFLSTLSVSIDILLVDYNLGTGLGTDLFEYIRKPFNPYKILHSETDDNLSKAFPANRKYDAVAKSKETAGIHASLLEYEQKILSVKIRGNNAFASKRQKIQKDEKFAGISLHEIYYAKSIGNNYVQIWYRRAEDRKIRDTKRSTQSLNFFAASDYQYTFLTNLIVINLEWVAKIDLYECIVSFITLDSTLFGVPFDIKDFRRQDVHRFIFTIKESLPKYFTV